MAYIMKPSDFFETCSECGGTGRVPACGDYECGPFDRCLFVDGRGDMACPDCMNGRISLPVDEDELGI